MVKQVCAFVGCPGAGPLQATPGYQAHSEVASLHMSAHCLILRKKTGTHLWSDELFLGTYATGGTALSSGQFLTSTST